MVTEDALKKIGRNVLKALGVGVEDRPSRSNSLPRHVRKAIKTCQVITIKSIEYKMIFQSYKFL